MNDDCSSLNVAVFSNTVPIYDELCRRVMNFINNCLYSDSNFVHCSQRYICCRGYERAIGRNVAALLNAHPNLSIGFIGGSKYSELNDFGRRQVDLHSFMFNLFIILWRFYIKYEFHNKINDKIMNKELIDTSEK